MDAWDRVRVHVLSDDARVRQAARSLASDRFTVALHDDPVEAIRAMRRDGADVAVIELQLRAYGGFAVVRDLAASPSTSAVRVVMLCDRPHDRWLCTQAGAHEVVVKPIADPSEIRHAVEAVLQPAG